jgi:hypothetical protein
MFSNPIIGDSWHGMGRRECVHGDRRPTVHDVQLEDNTEIERSVLSNLAAIDVTGQGHPQYCFNVTTFKLIGHGSAGVMCQRPVDRPPMMIILR